MFVESIFDDCFNRDKDIEEKFKKITDKTHCPYAKISKVKYLYCSDKLDEFDLKKILKGILIFIRVMEKLKLDAFVIAIKNNLFASEVQICLAVNKIFNFLYSQGVSNKMADDIETPNWRLKLCEEKFFLSVFSSCYNKNSTRYFDDPRLYFLIFQPKLSFYRHLGSDCDKRKRMHDMVKSIFSKNNMDYKSPDLEANRYIPIKNKSGFYLKWWDMKHKKNTLPFSEFSEKSMCRLM
ncbi:MAG: YqcI/YcgG family protein [Gammaproteobacteria bacterium]